MFDASAKPANRRICLYIPDRDRHGAQIERHSYWVDQSCLTFALLFGGATKLPLADGLWINDEGMLIRERTTLVYSFVTQTAITGNMAALQTFLQRLITQTNQESLGVEYDGTMYFIRETALA